MKNNVTITISGKPKCGKTTVARMIAEMLRGIGCKVSESGVDVLHISEFQGKRAQMPNDLKISDDSCVARDVRKHNS